MIIRDTTEKVLAEERYRTILQTTRDGFCLSDTAGKIIEVNQAFCDMIGYSQEELLEMSYADLEVNESPEEILEHIQNVLKNGSDRFETRHRRKDGTIIDLEVSVTFLNFEGGRNMSFIRDISQQKQQERILREAKEDAEEANRLKSSILANMSHEIRTPMTAILGFSEILTRKLGDHPHARQAKMIQQSGSRLLHLLDSIIDLARIEANKIHFSPSAHPLTDSVNHVVSMLSVLADQKGLKLEIDVDPDIIVISDPRREEQVLTNIVGNAIRFTEAGKISIRAHPKLFGKQQELMAVIEVQDTGIGIDADFLPEVFDEFRQESEGLSRTHEGSGLGLTVSKKLLERMNGIIEIESHKGQGTKVTIALPMKVSLNKNDHDQTMTEVHTHNLHLEIPQYKILIVEDDEYCSALFEEILHDHEVQLCSSSEEALTAAKTKAFDLIFMDINLKSSSLDGVTTLYELHKLDKQNQAWVYAITAYAMKGDEEMLLSQGFNGYLAKPFHTNQLDQILVDLHSHRVNSLYSAQLK